MKPPLKVALLTLLIYSCNNSRPTENKGSENKLVIKDTLSAKQDTNKALIIKQDTVPLPPEHYTKKGDELGFELMDSEKLGDLQIGIPKAQVIKLLGQPESKSDTIIDQVTGGLNQVWTYKKKGIILSLEGENYSGQKIWDITIMAPCTYKLRRRIGIGSTAQEIKKAYPKAWDQESNSHMIVLGSYYGGIQFTMHNNKVDTLFIGATAE